MRVAVFSSRNDGWMNNNNLTSTTGIEMNWWWWYRQNKTKHDDSPSMLWREMMILPIHPPTRPSRCEDTGDGDGDNWLKRWRCCDDGGPKPETISNRNEMERLSLWGEQDVDCSGDNSGYGEDAIMLEAEHGSGLLPDEACAWIAGSNTQRREWSDSSDRSVRTSEQE